MSLMRVRFVAGSLLALCLCFAVLAQSSGVNRGFDTSRVDKSTSACQDFYQFANGNWLKTTEIPAAFSSWGSFHILAENNRKTLHDILEEVSKKPDAKKGSMEQKIGDFYASCIDEAKIEAEGAKPLQPELARIEKIKYALEHPIVVTIEDGLADGGVGSAFVDELRRRSNGAGPKVAVLGVPDRYLLHAKPDAILAELGLDAAGVAASVRALR